MHPAACTFCLVTLWSLGEVVGFDAVEMPDHSREVGKRGNPVCGALSMWQAHTGCFVSEFLSYTSQVRENALSK